MIHEYHMEYPYKSLGEKGDLTGLAARPLLSIMMTDDDRNFHRKSIVSQGSSSQHGGTSAGAAQRRPLDRHEVTDGLSLGILP